MQLYKTKAVYTAASVACEYILYTQKTEWLRTDRRSDKVTYTVVCMRLKSLVKIILQIQVKISEFLISAETKIESLSTSFKTLKADFKSLVEYFALKKKSTTSSDFILTMKTFLGEARTAQMEYERVRSFAFDDSF